jgi:hypothetical protein
MPLQASVIGLKMNHESNANLPLAVYSKNGGKNCLSNEYCASRPESIVVICRDESG